MNSVWTGSAALEKYEQDMYVFTELDNLEYALEKYRLGYMTLNHANRALRTFRSRCLSPLFRESVLACVRTSGYAPHAEEVVEAALLFTLIEAVCASHNLSECRCRLERAVSPLSDDISRVQA
jgi:hypothetical protein